MHGGDIYRQQVTYDFSVNINPIGLPDAVRQVMENSGDLAMQYPDLQCQKLRIKLADCLGIRPEQILCGNGASELILAVCHMLRPKKALLSAPCFSGYETALQAVGTEVIRVPLSEADGFAFTEEYGRKLETRIKEEKPELLFLTTPNNPTGKLTEPAYIRRLLTVCEKTDTYLVLDECFMELTGYDYSDVTLSDSVAHLRTRTRYVIQLDGKKYRGGSTHCTLSGWKVTKHTLTDVPESLLIGGAPGTNGGEMTRCWDGTLYQCKVYKGLLSDTKINKFIQEGTV